MSKARELANLGNAYSDGALSNRNLLINNDFRIWQRGTIHYGGAGNWSYTADRWQAGYTATTEKIISGLKMTIGSNTTGNQLFQIIENIDDAFQRNSDTYTATIKFKAPVGVTAELYVKNWGNGWADLFSGSVAATGEEQTLTISGSSSALVSGGNPYFSMLFSGSTTGQIIEVYDTQLEVGDTATPFEHRSYGQELALCQRYYEQIDYSASAAVAIGHAYNANGIHGPFYYNEKRANPTISLTNGVLCYSGTTGQAPTVVNWVYATKRSVNINPVNGMTFTVNGASYVIANSSGCSVKIDAEL